MAELHPDGAALEQACGFETELLHQLLTHVFLKALGKHWRGPLPRVGWIISHRHQRTKRAIQDALHADAGRGQGLAEDDVVAGRPGCRRTHGALQVGLHYVAQHHEGLDVYAVAVQTAQTIHAVEQAAMADAGRIHERHADGQPIAGDRLTVGVAFVDAAGVSHCRLLDSMDRLRCLYGDRVDVESFVVLRDVVEADLQGTVRPPAPWSPSDNIVFGEALPATGISVQRILDRAFGALVPMADDPANAGQRTAPVLTKRLQENVRQQLVKKFGLAAASLFKGGPIRVQLDRKSTRLNSSHHSISYAVFCLKKKKKTSIHTKKK